MARDVDAAVGLLLHTTLDLPGFAFQALSLVDVRSDYGLRIPEGDWSTLGGYAFGRVGRVPKIGDRVPFPGGELEVIAMDGRRVAGLRVHRDNATKTDTPATAAAALHP